MWFSEVPRQFYKSSQKSSENAWPLHKFFIYLQQQLIESDNLIYEVCSAARRKGASSVVLFGHGRICGSPCGRRRQFLYVAGGAERYLRTQPVDRKRSES